MMSCAGSEAAAAAATVEVGRVAAFAVWLHARGNGGREDGSTGWRRKRREAEGGGRRGGNDR